MSKDTRIAVLEDTIDDLVDSLEVIKKIAERGTDFQCECILKETERILKAASALVPEIA